MKKWLLTLILFSFVLGGCQAIQHETRPQLEARATSTATATATETVQIEAEATGTTVENEEAISPSATPTPLPTELPKLTLTLSATLMPAATHLAPTLPSSEAVTITQIKMVAPEKGWGIGQQNNSGDRILYTEDGGHTWAERTPPISETPEQNPVERSAWAYFYDAQTAWVIFVPLSQQEPVFDALTIWRTTDGGLNWIASEYLPITGRESYFLPENFSFINPSQGWLLVHIDAGMSHDYSNLYATNDGGITWQKLIDPYGEGAQSLHNTGLAFADANFGWVSKDNLAIMPGTFLEQSEDGGQTWENIFLPAPAAFNWEKETSQCATSQPTFLESGVGILLVNCQTFDGQSFTFTYQSSDQGESWQSAQLPSPVQSLEFIDSQIGWALGRDLYQSSDGGLSWVKIKTVNWDGQFSFVDENTGWAVATNNEAIALVFTQDGGKTWQQIHPVMR